MSSPHHLFAAALVLLALCGPSQLAAEESASPQDAIEIEDVDTEEQQDEVETEALPQRDSERKLLEAASSITEQVAEIRGLPLKEAIPKGVQDREDLRQMLVDRFHDEVPVEEFYAEERVYKRLGLFPADLDYRELMLDLLTEQIAGFYDHHAKELYIMEGLPEAVQYKAMAHEIFHAIQDQHFDIGHLLEPFSSSENADFSLSRMALIEGDATVLMIDYELYEQGVLPQNRARSVVDIPALSALLLEMDATQLSAVEQLEPTDAIELGGEAVPSLTDSVLGQAPPIIRDTLLFPYIEGMRFVIRARSGRTWEEFDQIYDDPPMSTSQILHPERYFAEEDPVDIAFYATEALPNHELIYEAVFGELQIRSWLSTHLEDVTDAPSAMEVAAGWQGDRLRGYAGPDEELIVTHLSSWRSAGEAQAFAAALEKSARIRHHADSVHQSGDHGQSWCIRPGDDEQGERHYVEQWGELVLYIEGAPSMLNEDQRETDATIYQVRDAIWDSLQRRPFQELLEHRMQQLGEAGADETEQTVEEKEREAPPSEQPTDKEVQPSDKEVQPSEKSEK